MQFRKERPMAISHHSGNHPKIFRVTQRPKSRPVGEDPDRFLPLLLVTDERETP